MAHFISRSFLREYILGIARSHDPEIAELTIDGAPKDETAGGRNWRVGTIDPGPSDPDDVREIIAYVVSCNGHLVMVEDDDPRQGQVVGRGDHERTGPI